MILQDLKDQIEEIESAYGPLAKDIELYQGIPLFSRTISIELNLSDYIGHSYINVVMDKGEA